MRLALIMAACASMLSAAAMAQDDEKQTKNDKRRAALDTMARETLDELFATSDKARELYDNAMGYAVFENIKVAVGISGGGGKGVAVAKESGHRTYMKMGTAGLNLGLGGQKYKVIFLFDNDKTFRDFVDNGWQAGSDANAVAGTAGANAAAAFKNGMAVYQITDGGLMLQVDISGTKYWKNKKLNNKD